MFDDGKGNIIRIPAHKNILSVNSPVFDRIFYGDLQQAGDIKIFNATADAFVLFLQSFYKCQIELTLENVGAVWCLADKYMATHCVFACVHYLSKILLTASDFIVQQSEFVNGKHYLLEICDLYLMEVNSNVPFTQTVFLAYEWAVFYNSKCLQNVCADMIKLMGAAMIRTYCFLTCNHTVLNHILSIKFDGRNEWELFQASMQWAQHACNQKNIDGTNMVNCRNELGHSFGLIHFGEMTAAEFVKCLAKYCGAFSQGEIMRYSDTINSNNNGPPNKKARRS